MAWTAKTVAKAIKGFKFTVTVEFTDGVSTFQSEFQTTKDEGASWLDDNVGPVLKKLSELQSFSDSIPLNKDIPKK